jgi:hypothetical protein
VLAGGVGEVEVDVDVDGGTLIVVLLDEPCDGEVEGAAAGVGLLIIVGCGAGLGFWLPL